MYELCCIEDKVTYVKHHAVKAYWDDGSKASYILNLSITHK